MSEVARLAILVRPEAGTIGSQIDDIRGIASGVASKERKISATEKLRSGKCGVRLLRLDRERKVKGHEISSVRVYG